MTAAIRQRVLPHYDGLRDAAITPFGTGLINQTFRVDAPMGRFLLQRVNPIFPVAIQENIRAVTARLAEAGLVTPRLLPTLTGQPCLDLGPGEVWRIMTFIDGVAFEAVASAAQARSAGALVARFHRALDGLPHTFLGMRPGVHDTPRHIETLRRAVGEHIGHRLHGSVSTLAAQMIPAATAMPALPAMSAQICHGDLKFNNILFAGPDAAERDRALCLIDLDTVGPMSLAHEMADAWRSWCNRNGEDQPEAALDLDVFAASVTGYEEGLERSLTQDQRLAFLHGAEWISLELGARFAADALNESYFGWHPQRFAGRGEHNWARARGQWSLHQALLASRPQRARLLRLA